MEHLVDKIQDYIEGQLQGQELIDFENHLQKDNEFRNIVNLQREVHEIIHRRLTSNEDDLRATLFHAENEIRQPHQTFLYRIKPFMAIASAACILLVGYLFFFNSTSDLYDLPVMQSEIVRGKESNEKYEEAVKLYNQKSYAQSRQILNDLISDEPEVAQYQFYAALTYVGEENWKEGVDKLKLMANGSSIFKYEAMYYLAVSLVKEGKREDAITALKSIPTQGELGKKAEKLLQKLH